MGENITCKCGQRWSDWDLNRARWYQNHRASGRAEGNKADKQNEKSEKPGTEQPESAQALVDKLHAMAQQGKALGISGLESLQIAAPPSAAANATPQQKARADEKEWQDAVKEFSAASRQLP